MHHLSPLSRRKGDVTHRSEGCQDLVRFFALLRIKPHAPPLVRVPVNFLSFILANVLPQVGILTAFAAALNGSNPTPSIHRLWRGLPGHLILFAPTLSSLNVSYRPVSCLRHWCSPNIYAFHRYTRNSYLLRYSSTVFQCSPGLSPRLSHQTCCSSTLLYTQ